jgi:hypothetical protein
VPSQDPSHSTCQRSGDKTGEDLSILSTYFSCRRAEHFSSSEGIVGFTAHPWKYPMSGLYTSKSRRRSATTVERSPGGGFANLRCQRQDKEKSAAAADFAFDPDATTVQLDDLLADAQA